MPSDIAPAPVPPQEAPRKASGQRVLLMMIAGGFVLAYGGCALFASNFTRGDGKTLANIGALCFIVGAQSFVVGLLWALVLWVRRRIAARRGRHPGAADAP